MSPRRSAQAPAAVVMVRPHHFTPNEATAQDNAFQSQGQEKVTPTLAKQAYREMTHVAETLESHGVRVHVFEDKGEETPDSVFPNNWFSTHAGGHVAIYPLYTPNRRKERRSDIIEMLKRDYRVQDVIDYSGLEPDGLFLEGTGAMVLDHVERVAYSARSRRTDPVTLERFCTHFNYEPMLFDAMDEHGMPIYHTNVLMCIGTDFAMVGLEMITNGKRRDEIAERLAQPGREIVSLTADQINHFAGNAIELQGEKGRILALSQRAYDSLTPKQIATLANSVMLVPLPVPTIELAGGSVRCMLAGIHLQPRS